MRWHPRSAGEQERQRQADPGQHGGGLVALGQRVRGLVRCQVFWERETATISTPSAVPVCKAELLRPEAIPASCPATQHAP